MKKLLTKLINQVVTENNCAGLYWLLATIIGKGFRVIWTMNCNEKWSLMVVDINEKLDPKEVFCTQDVFINHHNNVQGVIHV